MVEMDAPADRFGLAGTTVAGRYRVERQVAEGGFAVVYRAHQIALDRAVALKVLKTPPGLGDAARARFEQRFATEARTIAKLQHPYIVDVYDYGVSPMPSGESAPWMALEWLEGETLEHELDRRRGAGAGGRSAAETMALLRPVIEAVAYAHRRGVVHRDIKPANIMSSTATRGPMLRMLDFGIAKIMEGDPIGDTRVGRSSGATGFSPDYAAPEQITYSRTGPWTDVHALGLLFTRAAHRRAAVLGRRRRAAVRAGHVRRRPTPGAPGRRRRAPRAGRREGARAVTGPALERRGRASRRARAAASTSPREAPRAIAPCRCPAGSRDPVRLRGGSCGRWGPAVGDRAADRDALGLGRERVALDRSDSGLRVGRLQRPRRSDRRRAAPEPHPPAHRAVLRGAVAADAQPCAVSVNSVPWAEVWIDGKNTGKHTPFVDVPIDCGTHRIDFKRPDLQIAESESIQVKPGQTFKRRYTLPGGGAD